MGARRAQPGQHTSSSSSVGRRAGVRYTRMSSFARVMRGTSGGGNALQTSPFPSRELSRYGHHAKAKRRLTKEPVPAAATEPTGCGE